MVINLYPCSMTLKMNSEPPKSHILAQISLDIDLEEMISGKEDEVCQCQTRITLQTAVPELCH